MLQVLRRIPFISCRCFQYVLSVTGSAEVIVSLSPPSGAARPLTRTTFMACRLSNLQRMSCLLAGLVFALVSNGGAANTVSTDVTASAITGPNIAVIEQQIQLTRQRFGQVAAELRDAKLLAAEKLMEYEVIRDQYQRTTSTTTANSLDHAQQRLALAEMGVESKTAKFDRIQKKLEVLANLRQQVTGENKSASTTANAEKSPKISPAPSPPADRRSQGNPGKTQTISRSGTTVKARAQPGAAAPLAKPPESPVLPVLSQQGKVTDAFLLSAELQKLEQHLVSAGVPADPAVKVKAYGTAIAGEIPLISLGANQYFARFVAPYGKVNLIVGARRDQYYRSELHLEFTRDEQGKEFVIVFDINLIHQPRTLVFQESLIFEQEMFAAHDY